MKTILLAAVSVAALAVGLGAAQAGGTGSPLPFTGYVDLHGDFFSGNYNFYTPPSTIPDETDHSGGTLGGSVHGVVGFAPEWTMQYGLWGNLDSVQRRQTSRSIVSVVTTI